MTTATTFLNLLFGPPLPRAGHLRIVTATPTQFPSAQLWVDLADIRQPPNYPPHSTRAKQPPCPKYPTFSSYIDEEVYFSPHPYADQTSAKKDNVSPKLSVCWMECDDPDFNPLSITPTPPSIVVETSPNRTHSYWLLSELLPSSEVEAINRALAYSYLSTDRSGWDLTQLLRIPTTYNHKYAGPPHLVRVTFVDPLRRYTATDFASLLASVTSSSLATPSFPANAPSHATVLERWAPRLSKELRQLLNIRQTDRSRALWRIYNECRRMGMTREEIYGLAQASPNNKFADHRFNSKIGLWRDVCSAFKMEVAPTKKDALTRIEELRSRRARGTRAAKYEEISGIIRRCMAQEGCFYYCPRAREAFFYQDGWMVSLGMRAVDCHTYLGTQWLLNGSTVEFNYIAEHLRSWTELEAPHVSTHALSYYDTGHDILYITDHSKGIWRLDGNNIDHVENGVDGGIFFRPNDRTTEYRPVLDPDLDLIDPLLLRSANFVSAGSDPDPDLARFLYRAWIYSIFFANAIDSRPILLVEGARGSGKTLAFKKLAWFLEGPEGAPEGLPLDPAQFRECVRERDYVLFDGVDAPWRSLPEMLSTVSTGITDQRRILYTDNRIAKYRLHLTVGITTMFAKFLREDISDRSLILRTERLDDFKPTSDLRDQVLRHRNELWGELLLDLNKTIAAMKTVKLPSTKLRMADFAKVLFALCEVRGQNLNLLVKAMRSEQDQSALSRDPVWEALAIWLRLPDNRLPDATPITANDLHKKLMGCALAQSLRYLRKVSSSKSLGHRLHRLQPNLTGAGSGVELHIGKDNVGRSLYSFTVTDERILYA